MEWAGLGTVECEISFPELITQDRSQKLKDLALAQTQGWVSKQTAASLAGKELNITSYEYELEKEEIEQEQGDIALDQPLTSPGQLFPSTDKQVNAVTGQDKTEIKKQNG